MATTAPDTLSLTAGMIVPASTCACMDLYFGLLPFQSGFSDQYCVAWELTVSGIYALSTSSFFFAEHCAQFSHGVLLVALWRRCWSSVEIFTSNEKERIIWLLIRPALDYITRKKSTG